MEKYTTLANDIPTPFPEERGTATISTCNYLTKGKPDPSKFKGMEYNHTILTKMKH